MNKKQQDNFNKETDTTAVFLTIYLVFIGVLSYFSDYIGNWKHVLEFVIAPFTIGLVFFALETMKEKKTELDKKSNEDEK